MSKSELARAFDDALSRAGFSGTGCQSCGGLSRHSVSMLVIEEGDEPARCEGCGLMLDGEGHAVGMRMHGGRVRSTLIVLCASPVPVGGFDGAG